MKKKVIYGLLIAFFIICSFKLVSILKNKEYYTKLLDEKTNIYVYGISAPRGRILDCNGKVLVDNIGIKTIYYNKIKGITKSKELEIAGLLANVLSVDEATIDELKEYYLINNNDGKYLITDEEYKLFEERKITKEEIDIKKRARITDDMLNYSSKEKTQAHIYSLMNKGYIYSKKKIASNLTEEEYAKIIESKIPGITGELSWDRIYLYGDTLKNIFGRIGSITKETKEYYLTKDYELTDTVGISYLENVYEDYLRGKKAKYKVGSDYTLTLLEEEQKGNDLILSIDIDMQIKTEEILKDKLILAKKYGNTEYFKDSYALVSDPLTGSIKAISGIRLNDDNTFSDISLNNINKSYTIGSAVKGATIAVGYKYNLIEPGKYINDSCVKLLFVPPKCSFKKLGKVNDLTALSNSSNYYQYMIAIKLTGNTYTPNMKLNATKEHFKKYREMLSSFGLGVKTGIDLPNEQTGIIGKTIADDLLLNLSIGQYDTYTPIEVLQYINSVATGKRIKLSLMQEIKNGEETLLENKSEVLNNVDLIKNHLIE